MNSGLYPYLIEFRLVGRIKHDMLAMVKTVSRIFETNMFKIVPHVSVVGPFDTSNEQRLIKDFESICRKTNVIDPETQKPIPITYKINGVDIFSKSGVVYLDVQSNEALDQFRSKLSTQLRQYCKLSFWDFNDDFKFHATVATKVPSEKTEEILRYINNNKPLIYEVPLLRATLLKNGEILCEYDFVTNRMLDRWEHKSTKHSRESIVEYYSGINEARKSKPRIFFTSDLHLNDRFVIDSCCRPFGNPEAMNITLINNWNSEVTPYDTVYIVGDLAHKYARTEELDYWFNQLNGNKIFIKGNDDRNGLTETTVFADYDLDVDGYHFDMKHDPYTYRGNPEKPDTWLIHGHTQNRALDKFPFIDREKRTINVSTDICNFRPVPLDEILAAIRTELKPGESEFMHQTKVSLFRNKIDVF